MSTMTKCEIEATWFSDEEIRKFRHRDIELVKTFLNMEGADKDTLISVYGLNSDRVQGMDTRVQRIQKCRLKVLQDQGASIFSSSTVHTTDIPVDANLLAESSRVISTQSEVEAQHRGLKVSRHITHELSRSISRRNRPGYQAMDPVEDYVVASLQKRLAYEAQTLSCRMIDSFSH